MVYEKPPIHKLNPIEKVVGEWIDGRSVYEKTVTTTITTADNTTRVDIPLLDSTGLTVIEAFCSVGPSTTDGQTNILVPYYTGQERSTLFTLCAINGGNSFVLRFYHYGFKNALVIATIRYIKN